MFSFPISEGHAPISLGRCSLRGEPPPSVAAAAAAKPAPRCRKQHRCHHRQRCQKTIVPLVGDNEAWRGGVPSLTLWLSKPWFTSDLGHEVVCLPWTLISCRGSCPPFKLISWAGSRHYGEEEVMPDLIEVPAQRIDKGSSPLNCWVGASTS